MSLNNKQILGRSIKLVILVLIYFTRSGSGKLDLYHCPEVKHMKDFNIFAILGSWYVIQYYSSSEESLTYHCMRSEFGLSNGNMDMKMRLTYKYVADPNDETQTGNITWQIPNPMEPGHWRHTENHYKGVYNTDVVDTDHASWLILLHCSDQQNATINRTHLETEKKFMSTFVLSRVPSVDKMTTDYLREKISMYDVDLEYLFPVNQTYCFGEESYPTSEPLSTTTRKPKQREDEDDDMYFSEDSDDNLNERDEEEEDLTNDENEDPTVNEKHAVANQDVSNQDPQSF